MCLHYVVYRGAQARLGGVTSLGGGGVAGTTCDVDGCVCIREPCPVRTPMMVDAW